MIEHEINSQKFAKELKEKWKRYVESYNRNGGKYAHLLSATHVVNRIIETACKHSKATSLNKTQVKSK